MKPTLLAFVAALMLLSGCAPGHAAASTRVPGWHLYINDKYGYEIQYPNEYNLWETGKEGERDGATIRVALKDYEAPTPVLDIQVEPRIPVEKFPDMGAPGNAMALEMKDVVVNGFPAKQAQYRWAASGDLEIVEIYRNGVTFRFMAGAGIRDFHQTPWWAIISTFHLRGK